MEFNINKVIYNVFEESPNVEKLSVNVIGKFGLSKEDNSNRVHFIEVNIEGTNEKTENITRSLNVVARLDYHLDKDKFPKLNSSIDEDHKYFEECLNRIAKYIVNITAGSDSLRAVQIDVAEILQDYNEGEN
ncbi:hypothetical protein CN503_25755 [Bacillus cereus]|uniref:hypothetical protein n=1 Tax=Bacillus cereus TaxID=1396 RepID=UPI000BF63463|nr:hypothetical protein [Bacillus cereus]PER60198.1 hypothetical protein CN503_25755 [Bacillus cereus]PFM08362.1 hypothetical protein COJ39_16675 [Bacillus cereus]